jgi:hypothetical protein
MECCSYHGRTEEGYAVRFPSCIHLKLERGNFRRITANLRRLFFTNEKSVTRTDEKCVGGEEGPADSGAGKERESNSERKLDLLLEAWGSSPFPKIPQGLGCIEIQGLELSTTKTLKIPILQISTK